MDIEEKRGLYTEVRDRVGRMESKWQIWIDSDDKGKRVCERQMVGDWMFIKCLLSRVSQMMSDELFPETDWDKMVDEYGRDSR